MINLLPPDAKREIQAARANNLLIRYNLLLVSSSIFLLLAIGVVYVYLNNVKTGAQATISDNQAKVADFTPIKNQADLFRQNLSIAKQILDRQVNYTKVMLEIAAILPSGTILSGLNLDASTFGTETTLVAQAKSYDRALALKDAFSESALFSNVHFQSITSTEGASDYPMTVTLNVTFKKDAAKA